MPRRRGDLRRFDYGEDVASRRSAAITVASTNRRFISAGDAGASRQGPLPRRDSRRAVSDRLSLPLSVSKELMPLTEPSCHTDIAPPSGPLRGARRSQAIKLKIKMY